MKIKKQQICGGWVEVFKYLIRRAEEDDDSRNRPSHITHQLLLQTLSFGFHWWESTFMAVSVDESPTYVLDHCWMAHIAFCLGVSKTYRFCPLSCPTRSPELRHCEVLSVWIQIFVSFFRLIYFESMSDWAIELTTQTNLHIQARHQERPPVLSVVGGGELP